MLKKTFFLPLVASSSLLFTACSDDDAEAFNELAESYNNELTEEHVSIAGTRLSIVPPPDMTLAPSFTGLENSENRSSIIAIELPTGYEENLAEFSDDGLAQTNLELIGRQEFEFEGFPAALLEFEQQLDVRYAKWLLLFGDDTQTVVLNASVLVEEEEVFDQLRTSVLTTVYASEKDVDPLSSVDFSIETAGTEFQLASAIGGTLRYTRDGQDPTEADDGARLSLAASTLYEDLPESDRAAVAENRFYQIPQEGEAARLESQQEIMVGGLQGYEIVGYTSADQEDLDGLVYQLMVFTDDQYFVTIGEADSNFEQNLADFQTLAQTFQIN